MTTTKDINVKDIEKKEWDSFCDVGLIATAAYKVEELLTEILSTLVSYDLTMLTDINDEYNKPKKDTQKDPSQANKHKQKLFNDIKTLQARLVRENSSVKQYAKKEIYGELRKMRNLTLWNLVEECFDSDKSKAILKKEKWTSITQYRADVEDIRNLRNDILHYGERTPALLLTDTERKDLIDHYERIVNQSCMVNIAALTADADKISKLRAHYNKVLDHEEWRAIRVLYLSLEKKMSDDVSRLKREKKELQKKYNSERESREMELQERDRQNEVLNTNVIELQDRIRVLQEHIRVITEDRRDLQRRYDEERKYREEVEKKLEEKERKLEEFAKLNRESYEQSLYVEFLEESTTTPESDEEEEEKNPADEVSNTADSLSALSTNEKPSEAGPSVPTSQENSTPTVVESAGKSEEDNAE